MQYIRAILRTALAQAMRWGYVDRNAAALASPPRMVRKPVKPLDADQAQRLIELTRDDRLGPLFAVAIYTGLRQGELLGLRWPDLDLDAGTLLSAKHYKRSTAGVRRTQERARSTYAPLAAASHRGASGAKGASP